MKSSDVASKKPARRYDIDWLRVLATLGVFVFHCLRFFDPPAWEVKNNVTSEFVTLFIGFFAQWMMPLFFIISGAAIFFALGFRDSKTFIKSRVVRIMLPYLLVGIFLLIPPIMYVMLVSWELVSADIGIVTFYSGYVSGLTLFKAELPWIALPMFHLWYLVFLFIFSLMLLPVFLYFRSEQGRALVSSFAGFFERPWAVFLFPLPIAAIMTLINPASVAGNINAWGGWPILAYPILLFYGYLIFSDKRFEDAIQRVAAPSLILAVLSYVAVLILYLKYYEGPFGTSIYAFLMFARAFNMWFFVVGFLGLGHRYLNFSNGALRYASEGSLPFYMLHQTVIQIIGFFIASWQMAILPKFIFLLVTAFIGIMLIYELPIRRVNVMRFLFGLKPKKVSH